MLGRILADEAEPCRALGPAGATLNAVVAPAGAEAFYRFEYASEADYDPSAADPYGSRAPAQDGSVPADGDPRPVSAGLEVLEPGTTYHYRGSGDQHRSDYRRLLPTVRANVADSGRDLSSGGIGLWIDGRRVNGLSYDRATYRLSYKTRKLERGRHTVLIVARDGEGLSASRFWE